MCKTSAFSKSARASASRPSLGQQKRPGHSDGPERRPVKRVSFSKRDNVLGRAQDYDRTSFEVSPMLRRRRPASSSSRPPQPSAAPPREEPQKKQTPVEVAVKASDEAGDDDERKPSHANFNGMWRRSHGFNWASLLLFSGVDEAAIADQAARMQSSSVVHLIDHDATSFHLIVHSDSGNTQDQHFFIGGQPRPNPTGSTSSSSSPATLSNMRWEKKGQALVLSSIDAATGDEMKVSRHLASNGTVIVQHYTARRAKTGETAEAITIFRKMVRGGGSEPA
eukprot:g17396.t1